MKVKSVPCSWLLRDGRRLDCGPYMSGALEAKLRLELLRATKQPLRDVCLGGILGLINAGRIKRVWVQDEQHGRRFLSSTDILKADLSDLQFIGHQAVRSNPKLLIRAGWTLITRAGSIGRMAYARPDMDGLACSEDVLRVVPDSAKIPPGYLYAYLSSKFGVPLVVSGTYGAIIQHIEPEHIADLPVPRLGNVEIAVNAFIEEVADDRARASRLRTEALRAFNAHFSLSNLADAPTSVHYAVFSVGAGELARLDAAYHSPPCRAATSELASCSPSARRLDEVARVFTPGIFKRLHVDDPQFGYAYFSGTELFQHDSRPRGFLSRRAPKIEDYLVAENWLLIQDAGQLQGLIGHHVRVSPSIAGGVVSNHLMRVVAADPVDAAYLSIVLASPHGYRAITRNAFGTSIPQLDPAHIGAIRVPWPSETVRAQLAKDMLKAWELEDRAATAGREAVRMVEDAIENGAT